MKVFGYFLLTALVCQAWGRPSASESPGEGDSMAVFSGLLQELEISSNRVKMPSGLPQQLQSVLTDIINFPRANWEASEFCINKTLKHYDQENSDALPDIWQYAVHCGFEKIGLSKDGELSGSFREFDVFVKNLIETFAGNENEAVDLMKSLVTCYDVPRTGEYDNAANTFFNCFTDKTFLKPFSELLTAKDS